MINCVCYGALLITSLISCTLKQTVFRQIIRRSCELIFMYKIKEWQPKSESWGLVVTPVHVQL